MQPEKSTELPDTCSSINANEKKLLKSAKKFRKLLRSLLKEAASGKIDQEKYEWAVLVDVAEYIKICNMILNGDYRLAFDYLLDLPTMVKAEFPHKLWQLIEAQSWETP